MSPIDSNSFINFNFDVSAYRLLGRELITDRITALFELVKNAYDANANNVSVQFIDINPITENSKIIISDDGLGMDMDDIRNKWMVIGTSSKRRERTSPSPYNRKVSGKKGVGRFAVDKLGDKLVLKTKKIGTEDLLCLETDWSYYAQLENSQLQLDFEVKKDFFTDIKNKYWYETSTLNKQGTSLEISIVNDAWTEDDVKRAYKELSKLVSPNNTSLSKYPFKITIDAPYDDFEDVEVIANLIDFSTMQIQLRFEPQNGLQEILKYRKGILETILVPKRPCGLLSMSLYYFNEDDKKRYKNHFGTDIDGVKIYRDGIITTPFAEYVADQNKQKDLLGLDKRRYSNFFDTLGTRDLLGVVEITDENNPKIIESTNRQDFVDNAEWKELKAFIVEQIQQIEKFLKEEKKVVRQSTKSGLGGTNEDLKHFKKEVNEIKKIASPEVKARLKGIESVISKIQGNVNRTIKEHAKLEEENRQKENLYMSLVSLQTYAAMFSHLTRHTIGHILTSAEYFYKNYPNASLEDRFKSISKRIYTEMLNLRSGVDFMLKYAKSDTNLEEIDIFQLVDNLFNNIYLERFQDQGISTEIFFGEKLIINYNRKAIEDIFDNLISNSIKALKWQTDKKIKCSGVVSKDKVTILFSDNGIGINEEDKFRIFDIFFTNTAEDGGAGMGLYVVKTRIESMQGEIEVVDSEFEPEGATFKIILPFKK